MSPPNHPFVVWAACYLWFISIFAITWSLILFLCVGDILLLTGTDLINAIVLLSGIILLPTNLYILYSVAFGKKIGHKSKVVCCPLWLCILWIIAVNCAGVVLCAHNITTCKHTVHTRINSTLKHYRSIPKYKQFIDNLQWSMRCCGLSSYRDWFDYDWYDKIRDYEWIPPQDNRHLRTNTEIKTVADNVPLSCCKSGSCVSNYLLELGTSSINTRGCGGLLYNIVMRSMIVHIIMFFSVIIVELLLLKFICRKKEDSVPKGCINSLKSMSNCSLRPQTQTYNVKHIMSVKDNFSTSSTSLQLNSDDSDEFDTTERRSITSRCEKQNRADKFRKINQTFNASEIKKGNGKETYYEGKL